jgi:hypothetical protein
MAAQLAQRLTPTQMQQQWAAQLNPLLTNPVNNSSIITNVQLKIGVNVINHLLGRIQQGWSLTDKQAACNPYRSAPFNDLTLTLTSDAVAIVNIEVF